ncbi:hypothetical protein PT276_01280 [Orbaceae bacterium ESL0721]|nr:hypothetical protein [Orbaceae bacterium ESL0721]
MKTSMKKIEIDEELYQYIAAQTQHIGEDASTILRRLLNIPNKTPSLLPQKQILKSDYTSLTNILKDDKFTSQKSIVNRFLLILNTLYRYNPVLFSLSSVSLHGSKRKYLSKDRESLESSGINSKPREIIGTPYWVITNTNTARKIYILEYIMNHMEIPSDIINVIISHFKM